MTDRLSDALETCLKSLEEGRTLDSALKLFPDLEAELRPILETALQARTLAVSSIPSIAQQRGRTRLLQRASELRQTKRGPSTIKRRLPAFPRLAVTLGLVSVFVLSSTGLVGASSNSLPGDQLYPVKRMWESVQLSFVFNQQGRETLQSEFDQERLNEIDQLLMKNRAQQVTFSGLITKQKDGIWLVSGIRVLVTNTTRLSSTQISNDIPVTVIGTTRSDGVLEADQIRSLQPGSMLPPLGPSNNNSNSGGQKAVSTLLPIRTESPIVLQTPVAPSAAPQSFAYTGVLQKEEGMNWTINGQSVSVDQAQVTGKIDLGSVVRFEGYYSDSGSFVVTTIETESPVTPSHSKGSNNSNNGHGDNNNGGDDNNGGKGGGNNNGGGDDGGGNGGSGGGD